MYGSKFMSKTTPWNKIKSEYLQGVTPKNLAKKYKLAAKQVSDKANKDKWTIEKSKICENVRENVQNKIERITALALNRLEDVLTTEDIKISDLVTAIGKALDISGLKTTKQETNFKGDVNYPALQGFESIEEAAKHFKEMIEG